MNSMADASGSELWRREYDHGGIPSSTRERPSNVVVEFREFIRREVRPGAVGLDIGCGTGRNTFYLAAEGFRMIAMDYVEGLVAGINARARERPELNIEAILQDVSEPWSCSSNVADFAIDTFCFKHQIDSQSVENYVKELTRSLKNGAYFLLFLAAKNDGYYERFALPQQEGIGTIIVDPENGIASRLYDVDELKILFSSFEFISYKEKKAKNEMHGKLYNRVSHILYMAKRS